MSGRMRVTVFMCYFAHDYALLDHHRLFIITRANCRAHSATDCTTDDRAVLATDLIANRRSGTSADGTANNRSLICRQGGGRRTYQAKYQCKLFVVHASLIK